MLETVMMSVVHPRSYAGKFVSSNAKLSKRQETLSLHEAQKHPIYITTKNIYTIINSPFVYDTILLPKFTMARRSTRNLPSSSPAMPMRKKRASSPPAITTPGERQSKRLKSSAQNTPTTASKATPKKSQYFEDPESDEEPSAEDEEDEQSGYEDEEEDTSAVSSPGGSGDDEEEDEDFSEEEEKVKPRKGRGRPKQQVKSNGAGIIATAVEKGKELWRQGVKTGLGPGKQVFIKTPKPREEGETKYSKDTIHPNTFLFLRDLKENNDREWLKSKSISLGGLLYSVEDSPLLITVVSYGGLLYFTKGSRISIESSCISSR